MLANSSLTAIVTIGFDGANIMCTDGIAEQSTTASVFGEYTGRKQNFYRILKDKQTAKSFPISLIIVYVHITGYKL